MPGFPGRARLSGFASNSKMTLSRDQHSRSSRAISVSATRSPPCSMRRSYSHSNRHILQYTTPSFKTICDQSPPWLPYFFRQEHTVPSRPSQPIPPTKKDNATTTTTTKAEECASSATTPPPPSAATDALNLDPNLPTQLRHLMRLVPSPVAIVTSTNPSSAPCDSQQQEEDQQKQAVAFKGMTISSFNTLTLFPDPVVFFNIKTPSETYNAILASRRFLVHLLAASPRAARLARLFAGGNGHVGAGGENAPFRFLSSASGSAGRQTAPSIEDGEPPLLSLNDTTNKAVRDDEEPSSSCPDFRVVLECQYLPQSIRVGTHVVVLGEVVRIIAPEKQTDDTDASSLPRTPRDGHLHRPEDLCMAYADTRFWKLGTNIMDVQKSG